MALPDTRITRRVDLIELKVVPAGRSLTSPRLETPAGKTSESPLAGVPPDQFAGVDQLHSSPPRSRSMG